MPPWRAYRDRTEAGRRLAEALKGYADRPDLLVLALPRGGIPVGLEIARALNAPLDVLVVRKLGAPGQPELAVGAIASGGIRHVNEELVRELGLSPRALEALEARERRELERRERLYRDDRPFPDVAGRTIILVDDGVATGATARAAIGALRQLRPSRLVVAVPVAAPRIVEALARTADEVVCPLTLDGFFAISLCYEEFPQLTDEDVRDLLRQAPALAAAPPRDRQG